MAQQDYVAFAMVSFSDAYHKFKALNKKHKLFTSSTHRTSNTETPLITLFTASIPFYKGYSEAVDAYLKFKSEEEGFDFIRLGDYREDYEDCTPNGYIYIDGDDVTVVDDIETTSDEKTYLAIVIGGTTLDWFNKTTPIPDVVKLIDKPTTREKAAKEMFANLEDAIVNCDERFIDVAKYKADGANQLRFRITDKDPHEADLQTLKQQLIDGGIDVVNVKPSACAPSLYCLVPVNGDS